MVMKSDVQLNAQGLACPMPIVKTKKVMNDLVDGQVLEVQATDKGSKADLAAWSKKMGHQFIGTVEKGDVFYHYIRKCNPEKAEATEKSFEQTIANDELEGRTGIVLDVREAAEFAFGHVPGAKSIPFGELEGRLNELDTSQEIYVICRTGTRSDMAAQMLADKGFAKVFNVLPGMGEWNSKIEKEVN